MENDGDIGVEMKREGIGGFGGEVCVFLCDICVFDDDFDKILDCFDEK